MTQQKTFDQWMGAHLSLFELIHQTLQRDAKSTQLLAGEAS
jgi:hypothetical protein